MTPEIHKLELRYIGPLSEISEEFIQGMLNRITVSFHKYGEVADSNKTIDFIACARQRIEEYERTGNTEFLIDAGNFVMFRHMHPLSTDYFEATDSDKSPGLMSKDGKVVTSPK